MKTANVKRTAPRWGVQFHSRGTSLGISERVARLLILAVLALAAVRPELIQAIVHLFKK
jgi:hypothetical protein